MEENGCSINRDVESVPGSDNAANVERPLPVNTYRITVEDNDSGNWMQQIITKELVTHVKSPREVFGDMVLYLIKKLEARNDGL